MHTEQKTMAKRLMITVPLFAITAWLMLSPFEVIWRYVSFFNQLLSVFTMWAMTVWLKRNGMNYWISIFWAMFFSAVCTSYILYAPEGLTFITQHYWGVTVSYTVTIVCGIVVAALSALVFMQWERKASKTPD